MTTNLREALAAKVREVPFQFGQAAFEGEEAEPISQAIYRAALRAAAHLIAESPELAAVERAANAWQSLMTSIEAIHFAQTPDGATKNEQLDSYIAAWSKQAAELTQLRAEVEALRVDAERWRVVRRSVWRNDRMQGLWGPVVSFDLRLSADSVDDSGSIQATLDSAIDAAIAAKPEPEKTK